MTIQQSACRSFLFGLILANLVLLGCGRDRKEGPSVLPERVADDESAVEAIRMVLNKQVEAWNQGNIRSFMEGYAQSDSLRFASGGDVWYGWDRTLQRYQETYRDDEMMGTLSFDNLDVHLLSSDAALVFGRWSLARSDLYTNVGGLFTLLFRRQPDGWRIVHDHTSSSSTNAAASDSLTNDSNNGQSLE